ncbi:hypothetical protein B4N89_18540 [Embleya scabrispora]|uniref:DUF397 domain-containing protein n=1 Tax=Embleya scabrispora TaxID=159449 RepID=A0A1T3P0N3_9ACTN|nr:DUF397 domain-containing protein [Embleya scabrispora]OPC82676.1 hypothetical protein B4N89_18540 [Embleya scabrispora]
MSSIESHAWRKSVRSQNQEACVEVAPLEASTGVRDTKDRRRGHLEIGPAAWGALLQGLRGERAL